MGKFELGPAIDVRLEPIKETFVHSPAPTVRSNRGAATASTASGLDFACRATSVLRFAWTSSVGWKGCPINPTEIVRLFCWAYAQSTVSATGLLAASRQWRAPGGLRGGPQHGRHVLRSCKCVRGPPACQQDGERNDAILKCRRVRGNWLRDSYAAGPSGEPPRLSYFINRHQ
jgi:hypothetical protein